MTATPIRYYKCGNQGFGVLLYPQIRASAGSGNIIWDGRKEPGLTWCIAFNQEKIVDFAQFGITQTTPFFLSTNVVWGTDTWETVQSFVFDPKSNMMATAVFYGGTHNGTLQNMGTQPHQASFELELASIRALQYPDIIEQIQFEMARSKYSWLASIKWPATMSVAAIALAAVAITDTLVKDGYTCEVHEKKATKESFFYFGPKKGDEITTHDGPVPAQVDKDWEAAIVDAVQKGAKDEGVKDA